MTTETTKISQLRELFADAPEVGKKALESPGELRLDASKADIIPEFPY